jgi:hypothetical protein
MDTFGYRSSSLSLISTEQNFAMKPHILTELQQLKSRGGRVSRPCPIDLLKLHLQKYPEQAAQLTLHHLKDYLILRDECKHLQHQIKLIQYAKRYPLGQSKISFVSPSFFIDAELTLEQQFRVEVVKRNLASEPNHNKIKFWAITYFHFFLRLSDSYLEIQAELLSISPSKHQPQLPHFL